jgi:hypothetical protein
VKKFLKEFQGWICLAGVIVLHFSDNRYLSKTAYDVDRKKDSDDRQAFSEKLSGDLSEIKKQIALLNQTTRTLDDHENRLRQVERKNL